MNASNNAPVAAPANVLALPARRERRERDFGIGYGNSSGYAAARRYVTDRGMPRFRCA